MLGMPRDPTGPAPDGDIQVEDAGEAEDVDILDDSGAMPWERRHRAP